MERAIQWISRTVASMPLDRALRFGASLGWVTCSLFRFRRGEILRRLQAALPERSERERLRILRRMYAHLGMNAVEMLRMNVLGLRDLDGRVTVEGLDAGSPLTQSGKPCLVLMGHIGNWESLGYLTRVLNRPSSVVVKPLKQPVLWKSVCRTREAMGLRLLPINRSYKHCLEALRRGDLLTMILDQNCRRSRGVFVEFFGRPACTSPGLAILAARHQLPVYPCYAVRRGRHRHTIRFLPPMPPPPDTRPASLQAATQAYTTMLESIIRDEPEQWLWVHRRWKTQPPPGATAPAPTDFEATPAVV